ncbi:hypothetical protein PMAYCL1PPCAC_18569, partial [Pristionchus mayeri]
MALFDLQPVVLSNDERIFPNASIKEVVELMLKREKRKLENISVEREMLHFLLAPLGNIFVDFINFIEPIDNAKFFHEDPLKQGLPNYSSIVKKPMDLCSIRENAKKGGYKNETEMKIDLDLIFDNCEVYNDTNEGVLLYSREIQKKMNDAYDDLLQHLKFRKSWYDELDMYEEDMAPGMASILHAGMGSDNFEMNDDMEEEGHVGGSLNLPAWFSRRRKKSSRWRRRECIAKTKKRWIAKDG